MAFNHPGAYQLVKRAVSNNAHVCNRFAQRFALAPVQEMASDKLAPWELAVLILTPVFFYLISLSLQYTLFEVLPALVMIEQPTTVVVTGSTDSEDDIDSPPEKAKLLDEEIVIVRQEPITATIKGAIAYLHTLGGVRSRWRGFWASIFYHFSHGVITHAFLALASLVNPSRAVMTFVCHMAATLVLCRLHMTWTHVVISPPSPLAFFKRIVRGRYVFKALALPSIRLAAAQQLVVILPAIAFFACGPIPEGDALPTNLLVRALAVLSTAFVVATFVLIPASAHLTRVEASLLPAETDTIVAFDRTFGGRVETDSKWSIRYLAAIASLSAGDHFRIAKYYAKAAALLSLPVVLCALWVHVEVQLFGMNRIQATLQGLRHQASAPQFHTQDVRIL